MPVGMRVNDVVPEEQRERIQTVDSVLNWRSCSRPTVNGSHSSCDLVTARHSVLDWVGLVEDDALPCYTEKQRGRPSTLDVFLADPMNDFVMFRYFWTMTP